MTKKKTSPYTGRWAIVSMPEQDGLHEDEPACIAFAADGRGEFRFGYVHGVMSCHEGKRDGQDALFFSWESNGEWDEVHGTGWVIRRADELHGEIAFSNGDVRAFSAVLA